MMTPTRNEVHKKDVLDFCKGMSEVVKDDVSSIDVSSAVLLWKFLSLLIKQNGVCINLAFCLLMHCGVCCLKSIVVHSDLCLISCCINALYAVTSKRHTVIY